MPELLPQERLQPSLLDRLTDLEPARRDESRHERVVTAAQLRESVARDIAALLNCTRAYHDDALDALPHVRNSVINYGIPDLAGTALSTIDVGVLQSQIRTALLDFEPRLIGSTVQVTAAIDDTRMDNRSLNFLIEAQMWAQPIPLSLFLSTDVDLETGAFRVSQRTG